MSSIVYLRNSKTNTIYAYLNESIWDPEKKKCINKRKCIGHVDPETGEIVPNRKAVSRNCPKVRVSYICDMLDNVANGIRLSETMALAFPDDWKKIMSIAYYLVTTRGELSFYKQWSEQNKTPYNQIMDTDKMNSLFANISANSISLFFTLWKIRVQPDESYVSAISFQEFSSDVSDYIKEQNIDIGSLSNRMRMQIYFSTKNNIPICYQLSNMATGRKIGDYDVSPGSFSKLSAFLDEENKEEVDASLIAYAKSNVNVRTRPDNPFVKDLVERAEPTMTNPENYRTLFGIPLFIETYMHHAGGRKYYAHIFFDPNKAVADLSAFISLINLCKYELEMDRPVEAHQDLYDKFLMVKTENGRTVVEHNSEAIMHHNKYLGYSAIISNFTRNPSTALAPFLQRRAISSMFNNMNNDYDNTALNLFTEVNYLSRIFIQFIALILRMEAENIMNSKKLNKTMSFKQVVAELSSIKTVRLPNMKKSLQTELSDAQIRILDAFDVKYVLE